MGKKRPPAGSQQAGNDVNPGFRVQRVLELPELYLTAREIAHAPTGARILHLQAQDPENLFAVAFGTPPPDSTGVPHILEHAVLAGSRNYPLKDVFNELMKGSLQTFLNAFTYPDKTIYPVASQTKADFFNLARVYCDLVFQPRLLEETFLQEGHRLEFTDPDNPESELTISGIVYNEMKGAYSSPENLLYRDLAAGLFPGHIYAHDSGGNPEQIPQLTYQGLKDFHARYYTAANARFFLYGDIPLEEHLAFLGEILVSHTRSKVQAQVAKPRPLRQPVRREAFFPLGRGESPEAKAMVNLAWLLAPHTDYETALLLKVVASALVGTAASPLRKALIDSGLGQDLSPATGLEKDLKHLVFAVGLRGTEGDKAEAIQQTVFEALARVAREGFDPELIEGVLHQMEFQGREIVRGAYPYGVILMDRVFPAWLHGGDPLGALNFPEGIARIRRHWRREAQLFSRLVEKWFLQNKHFVLSVLLPHATLAEETERARREKMAVLKAGLDQAALKEVREKFLALRAYQTTPDSAAARRCLPRLSLDDINPESHRIPTERLELGKLPLFFHDLATNGVGYVDVVFDVASVPEQDQPLLPLLGKLTLNMGAGAFSYLEMAKRIAAAMGGIGSQLVCGHALPGKSGEAIWQKLIFRVKFLYRNLGAGMEILQDLLTAGLLVPDERMHELVLEKKNDLYAAVIPQGHLFAERYAASALSVATRREETWHGRTQLRFLHALADSWSRDKEELAGKLAALRKKVFRSEGLLLNVTAEGKMREMIPEALASLVKALPSGGLEGQITPATAMSTPRGRGLVLPSQVSYVAKVAPAPGYDSPLAPYLAIIARHLAGGYLYRRIRVQGGAYGAMAPYDPVKKTFSFLSYRDPGVSSTLLAFAGAGEEMAKNLMAREELTTAIMGSIAGLDKPQGPGERGFTALIRALIGLDDKMRDEWRRRILGAAPEDIRKTAADCLLPILEEARFALLGPAEELTKGREILPDLGVENLL
jgi:Zn-dependent M16 (insulinase) family peptidase